MIITFTLNPSLDRTAEVPALSRGQVVRASAGRVDAGGKGINVTRALAANGIDSLAVLPAGGAVGAELIRMLTSERLSFEAVPIAGPLRVNLTLVEPDGTTTKINEPGPRLEPSELWLLCDTLIQQSVGADWAVLSGSVPPGVPLDIYAQLTDALHERGVRVALDADGELLAQALAAEPDLVKPNRLELEQVSGLPVSDPSSALAAAELVRAAGARAVLASLGPQGAVLVEPAGAMHASAHAPSTRSTVGAGDALLAGFLAAAADGALALAKAVAWGTAAVTLPGSAMPTTRDIASISVSVNTLPTLEATA